MNTVSLSHGKYELIQDGKICEGKSILFVKLTDSAHRTLNEYLRNENICKISPTIEFTDDSGVILIPSTAKKTSEVDTCSAQFKFNIDTVIQGSQGRFECMKHERQSDKMSKYGFFMKRLTVHANEDVYETTKNRMAKINQEQRKICTKEIDLKLETVNRSVKINRNTKSSIHTDCANISNVSSVVKGNRFNGKVSRRPSKPRNQSHNKITRSTSLVSKKPLRDRIIHMLAVGPLRKIELTDALNKDGLRDSEKAQLHSTLKSVAKVIENIYHLKMHIWNEIQEDWSFYSEQEREQIKKNKLQNLTQINSDNETSENSNLPVTSSLLNDESPSCDYKRPGYIKGVDGFQTKRLRISHFNRAKVKPIEIPEVKYDENIHLTSPKRVDNCVIKITEKLEEDNLVIENVSFELNPMHNLKISEIANAICSDSPVGIVPHEEIYVSDPSKNLSPLRQSSHEMSSDSSTDSTDVLKYETEYVTITDLEQRRRYKNDFLKYYEEYKIINQKIKKIDDEFLKLKKSFEKYEPDSPESSKIEEKCVEKFHKTNYLKMKQFRDSLGDKLTLIKQLVRNYDEKLL